MKRMRYNDYGKTHLFEQKIPHIANLLSTYGVTIMSIVTNIGSDICNICYLQPYAIFDTTDTLRLVAIFRHPTCIEQHRLVFYSR